MPLIPIEHQKAYLKAEEVPSTERTQLDDKLVTILGKLRGWATRYNLTRDGVVPEPVLQFALRTLQRWDRDAEALKTLDVPADLKPAGWVWIGPEPLDDETARRMNFEPAKRKRKPEHFEWFVRYQCAKLLSTEIAGRLNGSGNRRLKPDTIMAAVAAVADMAGLSLRKGERGPTRRKSPLR